MTNEDIISQLKALIPGKVSRYALLAEAKKGQYDDWAFDRAGNECLYYWVGDGKRRKRIPTIEITAAFDWLVTNQILNRRDFEMLCPVANEAGSCGYAALIRAFEFCGFGRVTLHHSAWIITGTNKPSIKPRQI